MVPEHDPYSIFLMTHSNCRTIMGGDPAFGQLISSIQSCTAFISEYHIRENYSLILPHPFRGEEVKQVARKTFDILQTSKICLVEAFWVFPICR